LRRQTGKAIADFNMIEAGDRIMVCISGGKDSHAMLELLISLRSSAPIDFEIVAVTLDQKQPGYPEDVLPDYLETLGVPFYILEKDTYSVVRSIIPEGKTTCGLCSRLRRGTLYGFAEQIGATKIALGHHRDDIVETLFLNLFFGGKLKAMPPEIKKRRRTECGDPATGVLSRVGYRRLRTCHAISDHSLQSLWHPGQPPATGDQGNADRLGTTISGKNRDHLQSAG
jgi:tRNA(Ile)-lysidine synthase TilS/MesJ